MISGDRSGVKPLIDELLAVTGGESADVVWPCPPRYRFDLYPEHLKRDGVPSERVLLYRPADASAVSRLLPWAADRGLTVVPFGLGSGVVGAIDGRADIVLSLERMNAIVEVDETSQIVTAEAGVTGQALESAVQERGFTLGQYPQSLGVSTVGGWVSTRATGTYSAYYGGIERSICGITAVMADGQVLQVPPRVRAPGGLDLLGLLCGSEGSIGVITEVSLMIFRRLDEQTLALAFSGLREGLAAQRELIQRGFPIGLMRLFNTAETAAVFGPDSAAGCVLLISTLGPAGLADAASGGDPSPRSGAWRDGSSGADGGSLVDQPLPRRRVDARTELGDRADLRHDRSVRSLAQRCRLRRSAGGGIQPTSRRLTSSTSRTPTRLASACT